MTGAVGSLPKRNDGQAAHAHSQAERAPNLLQRAGKFTREFAREIIFEPAREVIRALIQPVWIALALVLALAGCVWTEPAPPTPIVAARPAMCQRSPDANLRPDLPPGYVDPCGHVAWPDGTDGFAGTPLSVTLPADYLLDRFGGDTGKFLSPAGAPFAARALPYVCQGYRYMEYRVAQPLPVKIGPAAPWFGEPGFAVQVQTDKTVQELIADHMIVPVDHNPAPPC